jgi:[protein-PII] uridylyltransferase
VTVDETASDRALVVEAEGRDRPGLLFALASALADMGLEIKSAHIATYGERVVDAFYLQDKEGRKINDRKAVIAIEKKLLTVLGNGGPVPRK